MQRRIAAIVASVWIVLAVHLLASSGALADASTRRPIELADILAWKSLSVPVVSNNGEWIAYRLSPNDGDSEVVIRATQSDRELRFPIGEVPRPRPAGQPPPDEPPPQGLVFADNSAWAAFTIYPTKAEAARAKKQQKPAQNQLGLVNLAPGALTKFEKVRRFAFSGRRAAWLAIHRDLPDRPPADKDSSKDKPKGSDLILHELATGTQMTLGNVSDFAFDKAGTWLAWTVATQDGTGNGVHLRNVAAGTVVALDSGKASYERPHWTEKGDGLAVLKGASDTRDKGRLYTALGFTGFASGSPATVEYDPASDASFPGDMTISPNRDPVWTDDLAGILFGIDAREPADETDEPGPGAGERGQRDQAGGPPSDKAPDDERPDLVIWHWQDPRLQSQQAVQEERDKRFSYLAEYRVSDKKFIRLADEDVRNVTPPAKGGRWAVGFDEREYEVMASLDGRRYQDLYAVDLHTGARRLAAKRVRWYYGQSPDSSRVLYYDDGHYVVHDMASGQSTNVTKGLPVTFVNLEDDHNNIKPPVPPIGWASGGTTVLLFDGWDIWSVPAAGGPGVNLTVNGRKDGIRYRRRYVLDPDETGINLAEPVYVEMYGEWTKKRGIARIEGGKPGARALLWDDAAFARVLKAKERDVLVYSRETFKDSPDLHVADAALAGGRKVTDISARQSEFLWSDGSMIVDYTSAKGDRLQGALFLPANYQKGRSYPTIVYIYERLSQDLNEYFTPRANGFNKSVYTSHGYAVLMPDIKYRVNDPGMSAVWCVLPALKAAIATGVVDERRVGLHGHSWGGYQTSLLITQTDAFKAAVAGAPLTNMVSMYSLVYKNTGGGNGAIFESSQGRFAGGYWENWEAYLRNSPIYHARHVKTPLLMLHNDKDGAVDFTQGIEYFNTLRRMRKPVVLLEYPGENHGLRKPANQQDYTVRMREFFDHHLTGKAAPDWLKSGVPRLDMERHLKERSPKKKVDTTP